MLQPGLNLVSQTSAKLEIMPASESVIYGSPVEVHFIVQNLNGSTSRGRQERRAQMAKYLARIEVKPDFLALQDGVRWVDVGHFIHVLNKRHTGSEYEHVADRWVGNSRSKSVKPTALYSENQEGLIYNSSVWERLKTDDDFLRPKDFEKHKDLLSRRFRAGKFRHRLTSHVTFVVSYHGRRRRQKRNRDELTEELREKALERT